MYFSMYVCVCVPYLCVHVCSCSSLPHIRHTNIPIHTNKQLTASDSVVAPPSASSSSALKMSLKVACCSILRESNTSLPCMYVYVCICVCVPEIRLLLYSSGVWHLFVLYVCEHDLVSMCIFMCECMILNVAYNSHRVGAWFVYYLRFLMYVCIVCMEACMFSNS
jgi:hypothetical protein